MADSFTCNNVIGYPYESVIYEMTIGAANGSDEICHFEDGRVFPKEPHAIQPSRFPQGDE